MDVYEAIRMRRSVRAYDSSRQIPPQVMERLRRALWAAPSACNLQPWHFIIVTDPQLRKDLARIAHDQMFMADAPVIIVACGYPDQAYQHMGGHGNSVEVDVAIALDHLTLAAVAEGLGTCWIGAFDEEKAKKLLGVPPNVRIIAMTPVGYPATPDLIHPLEDARRKPIAEIFSTNRYGQK
jgi:nitroreductase